MNQRIPLTIRVAHTPNMQERLEQARRVLGLIEKGFGSLALTFQAMCRLSMDKTKLADYLAEVFPAPKDQDNLKAAAKAAEQRFWAEYFFEQGKGNGLADVRGTLWAAYNGVVELIDHRHKPKQTSERRLDSVWFGDGYFIKARALRAAKERLKLWAN